MEKQMKKVKVILQVQKDKIFKVEMVDSTPKKEREIVIELSSFEDVVDFLHSENIKRVDFRIQEW